jgi:membrane protein
MTRSELMARVAPVREAYAEHGLATHAAAIAFRVLVALVPLTLLALALLGAFGLEDTWHDSIAPELRKKLQPEVFRAVDSVVTRILESPSIGLILLASALLLWELVRGVRAVSRALNTIHGVDDQRPAAKVALTTLGSRSPSGPA